MSVLPRIVQFCLQLAAGWYWGPAIKQWLPNALLQTQPLDIFFDAFIIAVLVMVVGHSCAWCLKDIRRPSGGTLAVCFALAFLFSAVTLIPQFNTAIEQVIPALRTNRFVYPLIGAMLGYWIKR